jgi:hypothetical protein
MTIWGLTKSMEPYHQTIFGNITDFFGEEDSPLRFNTAPQNPALT